jgi:exonuclease SbcD
MYYDFLVSLRGSKCTHIIITGGNHDSPGTINAPKELLDTLNIKVVGKASNLIEEEVFALKTEKESVIIAAVPYLRDQDIRRAVEGETFDQVSDRYKHALINHYKKAAAYCLSIKEGKTPLIAMGHLFAVGGSVSDSEQSIYVGSLGHIGAHDFPEVFDYIALGHLHRPQIVGDREHIRYSGSPVTLSFSELNHEKGVLVLSIEQDEIKEVKEVLIPKFRKVLNVNGSLDECIAGLQAITTNEFKLRPWVEVVIDNDVNAAVGYADVYKATEDLELEVLKVTLKNQRNTQGIDELKQKTKEIKELSPADVFTLKCQEQGYNLEENPDVFDAFNEALQIAKGH